MARQSSTSKDGQLNQSTSYSFEPCHKEQEITVDELNIDQQSVTTRTLLLYKEDHGTEDGALMSL